VIGVVTLFVAGLLLLPLLWVEPKLFKVLLTIGSAFGAFGLFAMLQGMWQLHFALNPNSTKEAIARPAPAFTAPRTQALPAVPGRASVTEGTTELLTASIEKDERRTLEPLPRRAPDTGEVDDERLM
jgi:hypothetical protein